MDLQIDDPFIHSILYSWAEINQRYPCHPDEILDQVIWYNTNIRNNKLMFYFPDLAHVGINCTSDIFNVEIRDFYTAAELNEKYGVHVNFVLYYRIVAVIPVQWKNLLRNPNLVEPEHQYRQQLCYEWQGLEKTSKLAYKRFRSCIPFSNTAARLSGYSGC